jgi:hypothetical protein
MTPSWFTQVTGVAGWGFPMQGFFNLWRSRWAKGNERFILFILVGLQDFFYMP